MMAGREEICWEPRYHPAGKHYALAFNGSKERLLWDVGNQKPGMIGTKHEQRCQLACSAEAVPVLITVYCFVPIMPGFWVTNVPQHLSLLPLKARA